MLEIHPLARLIPVVVLSMVLPLSAQAKTSAPSIGAVKFIQHHLTVQAPNGPASSAQVKQPLFAQYGVHTKAGDKASLSFVDGSILHVNQRTDLVLRSARLTVVRRGEVAVLDGLSSHHQISTPTAVASALGTEFDVRIERQTTPSTYPTATPVATPSAPTFPPGTTTVSVVAGTVVVSNRFGSATVRAGQWTHVPPGQAPTKPTRHNAKADVAWTSNLPSK